VIAVFEASAEHEVGEVLAVAESVANSRPISWLARIGLCARAIVYLVMGWLAVLVATGGRAEVDQRGALTKVLIQPFGTALVWLLAIGFAAYALWRLSEAVFGVTGEGNRVGPRLHSLARGIAYGVLTFSALSLLEGSRSTQTGQQMHIAGALMQQTGGRWIVAIVGLVVVVVGLAMIYEGSKKQFLHLFGSLPIRLRDAVALLGRVGTIARGAVFAVAGALVVVAAWSANSAKVGGIDEALRTLLHEPFGTVLVVLLGIGLIVFGVYGLAQAAWQRVSDGAAA
jgi:hypothetical protein